MKKGKGMNAWLREFAAGTAVRAQEVLGSRFDGEEKNAVFRVWAPDAELVSVAGDFNDWNPDANPMKRIGGGVWETRIAGLTAPHCYKYAIQAKDGQTLWKADPYGFYTELRPGSATRLYDLSGFKWGDGKWLEKRREHLVYDSPQLVYEVHAGSWKRREDGGFLSWRELAKELIPYVKSLGFTHIELMPVTEHPLDASWGYQCTGYFAATSRFGEPCDLMYFVNACHKADIGVIMDWSPAHFPKDPQGLVEFDGSRLYEYADWQKAEHPSWGTRVFDYGKGEVVSFLISSALFWLETYHMDGIRVDAVASMLYLDYDRQPGEWTPNEYGDNGSLEAMAFFRKLNETAFSYDESVLMIAEESTSWPQVTMPTFAGGLGFNLKWNMGWMNDSLKYMGTDPLFRVGCHNFLTFSLTYAFSENFVLPLSHDEVVHMKGSLYNKMPGTRHMKLAGMRAFWAYILAHPGKKLLFMGSEFGQRAEWNYDSALDWFELDDPKATALSEFWKAANKMYKRNRVLWEIDFDASGFEWICPDENEKNVIGFIRKGKSGKDVVFVCCFSGAPVVDFRLGLPVYGEYEVFFSTDDSAYGGSDMLKSGDLIMAGEEPWHFREQSALITLPPLSAAFLRLKRAVKKPVKAVPIEEMPDEQT